MIAPMNTLISLFSGISAKTKPSRLLKWHHIVAFSAFILATHACDKSPKPSPAPTNEPGSTRKNENTQAKSEKDVPITEKSVERSKEERPVAESGSKAISPEKIKPEVQPSLPGSTKSPSPSESTAPSRVQKQTEPAKKLPPVPTPEAESVPRIDLVGLPAALRTDIEAAYESACKMPNSADALGELGMLYFVANSHLAASNCFQQATKLDPKSLRWNYYLGLAAKESYDEALATKAFESALTADPEYTPAMVELADLIRATEPQKAKALYESAVKLSPKDARAYLGLGECALAAKDYETARKQIEHSISLGNKYADAHGAMVRLLEATGEKKNAGPHMELQRAGAKPPLANDPLLVDLLSKSAGGDDLLILAERLSRAGQIDDAIAILRRAIERNDSDQIARHALGVLLTVKGRFPEAVQEFRTVLAKNPYQVTTIVDLARALARIGNFSEAKELLSDVMSGSGNDARAAMLFGHILLQTGASTDAARYFEGLVKSRPDFADTHMRLAQAMVCIGRYDVAVKEYQRWLDLEGGAQRDPRQFVWQLIRLMTDQRRAIAANVKVAQPLEPRQLAELATAFQTGGMAEPAAACRSYLEIIAKNAARFASFGAIREAERVALVGLIGQSSGEPKIVALLREQAMSKPDVPGIRHVLAATLSAAGDKQAAASEWRQLIAANPNFELAYLAWSIDLMDAKQYKATQDLLREGLQKVPDSPLLANALAWALAAPADPGARNGDEAVTLATSACEKTGFQDPELLDTLAAAYSVVGNYSKAVKFEQDAIKIATQSGQVSPIPTYRKRLAMYNSQKPIHEGP